MTTETAAAWRLTRLSGAGTSTLAQALASALRERAQPVCVINGDELRSGLCNDVGFDGATGAKNVRRASHLAQLLNSNGIHTVVDLVCPAAQARAVAYTTIWRHRCREIHVSTPFAVCEKCDTKDLCARARAQPAGADDRRAGSLRGASGAPDAHRQQRDGCAPGGQPHARSPQGYFLQTLFMAAYATPRNDFITGLQRARVHIAVRATALLKISYLNLTHCKPWLSLRLAASSSAQHA